MKLPKNSIKNPLTIIAMFAAIAEISGTVVLPLIDKTLQSTFMWFLMLFPLILVLLFFYTLHKKHHVLYAPSDFHSDNTFSDLIPKITGQTTIEQKQKTFNNVTELETENKDMSICGTVKNPKIEYFVAEELALKRLEAKYDFFQPQRAIEIAENRFTVDGLIKSDSSIELFEIKYFSAKNTYLNGIGKTYKYFETISKSIESSEYKKMDIFFHIIIVTPVNKEDQNYIKKNIDDSFKNRTLKINFKIWDFNELKKEYGI